MHAFRKLFAASAAAIVAMVSGITVAQADTTPSVYNTPGGQISAGRLWNTTCEKYSTNVVRCRANIWGTQVTYVKGRYVSKTGWTFNNLSYLPSPRASWAGNNLGQSNPSWNSGGRKWKTECDTATTGQGGCRSYVWTKKVIAVKSGSGYVYKNNEQWVFNNLVLFSSSTVPAVTQVPAWIIDQSRLDFTGLGPLQVGVLSKDLETLGYLVEGPCEAPRLAASAALYDRGVTLVENKKLNWVQVEKPGVKTVDGAHVGMTLAQVKAIYGSRLHLETKFAEDGQSPVYTAVVQNGGYEIVFVHDFDYPTQPLKDTDVITYMNARKIDSYLRRWYYDC